MDDSGLLEGLNARLDPLTGKIIVSEADYPALLERAKNNAKLRWYIDNNKVLIESKNADLTEAEIEQLKEAGIPVVEE